jgi:CheY-like chemotaxis protein
MGSDIELQSEPGKGSTFTFKIVCPVSSKPEVEIAEQMPRLATALNNIDRRMLAVDDNLTNLRIIQQMTAKWGWRTDVASSGAEALDMLRAAAAGHSPYTIVLLDALMPGIDGFAVAKTIKEDNKLHGIPVMMLSSSDLSSDATQARQQGIRVYVIKPVGESDLRRALETTLEIAEEDRKASQRSERAAASSLRILVAEDNQANRHVAMRLLEKRGHRVELAFDGNEVLRLFEEEDFDAILMDVQMPNLDGLQTTVAIREREKQSGKHVPIIALTAHAMAGYGDACTKVGMDGYLTKPIQTRELDRILKLIEASAAPSSI